MNKKMQLVQCIGFLFDGLYGRCMEVPNPGKVIPDNVMEASVIVLIKSGAWSEQYGMPDRERLTDEALKDKDVNIQEFRLVSVLKCLLACVDVFEANRDNYFQVEYIQKAKDLV